MESIKIKSSTKSVVLGSALVAVFAIGLLNLLQMSVDAFANDDGGKDSCMGSGAFTYKKSGGGGSDREKDHGDHNLSDI
jgi:hypothetical protein